MFIILALTKKVHEENYTMTPTTTSSTITTTYGFYDLNKIN